MIKQLFTFIIISFAISWACWFPILDSIESSPFESAPTVLVLFFLGAYGPTITGIFLTFLFNGKDGFRSMKSRLKLRKRDFKPIIISLVFGPVLYALAFFIYTIFNEYGEVNYGLLPWIPVIFIVSVIFGPLAEEFGWRGFALPLLKPKSKPIVSSIIIGLIWAAWHIPLFWAKSGTAISGFSITIPLVALFFMAVIGSSFIYTWVFNRTMGNISIAILLHLSMNASGSIRSMLFPEMGLEQSFDFYKLYVIVLWVIVISYLLFSQFRKKQSKVLVPES